MEQKTSPGTYTTGKNWFVALTPSAPPDDPDIPDGAIGISTIEELQLIGNDPAYPLDEYYVLLNDIDASATETWNDGAGFAPIGSEATLFTGTLNGQGFGVINLYIDRPNESYVGLVGYNVYGTVTDCYATGAVTGNSNVGVLVGYNVFGTVTNCYATGAVTGNSNVGVLVGYNVEGTVTNCYATGTVTGNSNVGVLVGINNGTVTNCYATGAVTGDNITGGLVGYNFEGTVTNCYATGAVTGNSNVGGLVGYNIDGTVTNCYASGEVTGNTNVGGLVGVNSGTVTASYYDTQTTGQADNMGKGAPRTTAAMYQQATFTGWDFGLYWTINEGVDYPRLIWESA